MRLFDSSWAARKPEVERSIVADLNSLPRNALLGPSLAGELDNIVSYHTLNVARLIPSQKKGRRRGVERVVDDWGEARRIVIQMMDMTIPFEGDPTSFRLAPSYCTIPSYQCEVDTDHLLVTMADDDVLQRNVDQFVQQVGQNLDGLRSEIANWVPQIRAALDQVANARIKEIQSQNDRDKRLDFEVD